MRFRMPGWLRVIFVLTAVLFWVESAAANVEWLRENHSKLLVLGSSTAIAALWAVLGTLLLLVAIGPERVGKWRDFLRGTERPSLEARPPRPRGVSEEDWLVSRMTGTELQGSAPPDPAEVRRAFDGLVEDMTKAKPERPVFSALAHRIVAAQKEAIRRGPVLLRRHYDEGLTLQRRLRTPRMALSGTFNADRIIAMREAVEWVRHLETLLEAHAHEQLPALHACLQKLRAEVAADKLTGDDIAMEFVDRNMRLLKTYLMDQGAL